MNGYRELKDIFVPSIELKKGETLASTVKSTERNLSDLSQLKYSYHTLELPQQFSSLILVVQFEGKSGFGCRNNDDAAFMSAIIAAGIKAWNPAALILDLQSLEYAWGDMMANVLSSHEGPRNVFLMTTCVIVSDLNREGLTSLVRDEMMAKPEEMLFKTMDDALMQIQTHFKELQERKTLSEEEILHLIGEVKNGKHSEEQMDDWIKQLEVAIHRPTLETLLFTAPENESPASILERIRGV